MFFLGANAAGLYNKKESLLRLVSLFSPGVIFIQETKARTYDKFKMNNYVSFEVIRTDSNGGGLMTSVHKALDPIEISKSVENEVLVVEAKVSGRRIRLINGYGPQEHAPENVRNSFFDYLDLEIKRSKISGSLICVEMDSNSKLGPNIIPKDPHEQSANGKLLEKVIIDNDLVVVNAESLCKGTITRFRKTVHRNEESILDHILVCRDFFQMVTSMTIDESGSYSLTKFSNKSGTRTTLKPSDHRTLLLNINLSWTPQSQQIDRIEVFDYKNTADFEVFVSLTNNNEALRTCFDNEEEDIEISSKRWLKLLKTAIKQSFKKIRIKKSKLEPALENLLRKRECLISGIHNLERGGTSIEAIKMQEELDEIDVKIAHLCANNNKNKVKELIIDSDTFEGGIQAKIWSLRKKLAPKNVDQTPMAKKDESGNLLTSKTDLEDLYLRTYTSRLTPNPVAEEFREHSSLKSYLLQLETMLAQTDVTRSWTLSELDAALKTMKNGKARDSYGHVYELFKFGGNDLKASLLALFNKVKQTQTYPSIFHPSTITSIWKRKGNQSELDNDRGIFNVTKIRSILDKLVYNDIYETVDDNMSCSNIGARKNRNIRDHLFVINGILNEAVNGPKKQPIDLQIYDISKCFDKLEYVSTANDLYNAGIQNDKFILVANSNKSCEVKIRMPWGNSTDTTTLKNIEMQGTVLAPLKCSISIDQIGKDALSSMSEILYTYKNIVTIPPLSMIDDIIAVTTCSLNSIYINATIEAKTKAKQLELSQKKSAHMHVGKNEKSCKQLTVNGCAMTTSSKQTYLGDVLSSNGKIDLNITERYNKGLGVANQVFSILKEVHFGHYYFEMAVLFRDSMLVNSILCSVEALYGVKKAHVEKLEAVDRILLRKVLNARYATAIEAFYLETGLLPIRFIVIARRLLYYWSILQKSEKELVRQVYDAQKLAPLNNDWILQIKDDLNYCEIYFGESDIAKMKKQKFKSIVKESIRFKAWEYLVNLQKEHSKSKGLTVFKMQPYLLTDALSIQEKQLLFQFRTYTYEAKANYRNKYISNFACLACDQLDSQEHFLRCKIIDDMKKDILESNIKYEDIFGTVEKQVKIVKVLKTIDQRRSLIEKNKNSSSIGSQVHHNPNSDGG